MVTNATVHYLDMYVEEATPVPFLTTLFQTPPRNFFTSEKVAIDVMRDQEEVAIALQDLSAGTRENELAYYQNKGFPPPVFDESATLTAWDMIKRQPGQDVFTDPDYLTNATEQAFSIMRKLENKIRRAVELQCAQVLTTGKVNLVDGSNRPMFNLDYGPRTAHFPTAGTAWGTGSEDKLSDIGSLASLVRVNGKGVPNKLIFGKRAWRDFWADTKIQKLFDVRRFEGFGNFSAPQRRTGGASYKGTIAIDNYDYEIWTYDGTYQDPVTKNIVNYLPQDAVIVLSDNTRLDLVYGAIPLLRAPQAPALQFLPPRFSSGEQQIDLTINAYFTPDGKRVKLEVGTRPLAIPTAIDKYGCLTTR